MAVHDRGMEIGEEWIYRLKTHGASERVRILGIEKRKQSTRVDIEFLDGERTGARENVPATRLHGPWSAVTEYDERMANWARLDSEGLDEIEQRAVLMVLIALIPEEVAIYDNSQARHGITVDDVRALETLMQRPMSDVLEQVEWFECDEALELSSAGTILVSEYVCSANPMKMLETVMADEAQHREHCKRGRDCDILKEFSPPEREYAIYRKFYRPVHELVRSWCGHRLVTFVERLTAAEAEVQRLDILVAELIDSLRAHNDFSAEAFDRQHNEDRVRPETVRPVVDRPLAPWEMPVREVPARRGRWW